MNSTRWQRLPLAMAVFATLCAGHAAADDSVTFYAQPGAKETTTVTGKIREDSYRQVLIAVGGADRPIRREQVVSVTYEAMPAELAEAQELLDTEQWAEAEAKIRAARASAQKIDPLQKKLIEQYIVFQAAELLRLKGDMDNAIRTYRAIIGNVPDSSLYADAMLGIAKTQEQIGTPEALRDAEKQYAASIADFKAKMAETAAMGTPYALASFGQLRILATVAGKLEDATQRQTRIAQSDVALEKLVADLRSTAPAALANEDVQHAAKEVRALVWQGQGKWKELIDFLDREILRAQQRNQKKRLEAFYLQRADANFESRTWNGALTDYLRILLVYEPEEKSEAAARANFRIAKCFMELKGEDWRARAQRHLGTAQRSGIRPWSTLAAEEYKTLSEAAATGSPAAAKAGAAK